MESRLIKLLLICLVISACSNEKRINPTSPKTEHSQYVNRLWHSTITEALSEPLWLEDFAYDAANALMLPMYYSFKYPERFTIETQQEFNTFFREVSLNFHPQQIENRVVKTQFMYFTTQYLKLRNQYGFWDDKDTKLFMLLTDELHLLWNDEVAIHWDQSLNFVGIKERVLWKLQAKEVAFSYYNAFIDEEWFTIAAISDLINVGNNQGLSHSFDNDEIYNISTAVLSNFLAYEDQYLYFQKGTWFDHRDYRYAGHENVAENLAPSYVKNIAVDSSHSHRLPLFIDSFSSISSDKEYYKKIISELMRTFSDQALTSMEIDDQFVILQNNYFDGHNGLYRYSYSTLNEGSGYGPYQLSGTLFVGYYAFFESDGYRDSMKKMQSSFPINDQALALYVGPKITRARHYLFDWPAYFNNGFAELFTYLSACYNGDLNSCEIKEQN